MGVCIPSHLATGYQLALVRPVKGGPEGWKAQESGTTPPYWTGAGYTSLSLGAQNRSQDSAEQRGMVLFYLDPAPAGGELPKASDRLLIDGVETEVLSVRPPNRLIDYWKLEVKTGAA